MEVCLHRCYFLFCSLFFLLNLLHFYLQLKFDPLQLFQLPPISLLTQVSLWQKPSFFGRDSTHQPICLNDYVSIFLRTDHSPSVVILHGNPKPESRVININCFFQHKIESYRNFRKFRLDHIKNTGGLFGEKVLRIHVATQILNLVQNNVRDPAHFSTFKVLNHSCRGFHVFYYDTVYLRSYAGSYDLIKLIRCRPQIPQPTVDSHDILFHDFAKHGLLPLCHLLLYVFGVSFNLLKLNFELLLFIFILSEIGQQMLFDRPHFLHRLQYLHQKLGAYAHFLFHSSFSLVIGFHGLKRLIVLLMNCFEPTCQTLNMNKLGSPHPLQLPDVDFQFRAIILCQIVVQLFMLPAENAQFLLKLLQSQLGFLALFGSFLDFQVDFCNLAIKLGNIFNLKGYILPHLFIGVLQIIYFFLDSPDALADVFYPFLILRYLLYPLQFLLQFLLLLCHRFILLDQKLLIPHVYLFQGNAFLGDPYLKQNVFRFVYNIFSFSIVNGLHFLLIYSHQFTFDRPHLLPFGVANLLQSCVNVRQLFNFSDGGIRSNNFFQVLKEPWPVEVIRFLLHGCNVFDFPLQDQESVGIQVDSFVSELYLYFLVGAVDVIKIVLGNIANTDGPLQPELLQDLGWARLPIL